jgi:TRAP-type C4-dicarboxylate transport system substrate-binding protein
MLNAGVRDLIEPEFEKNNLKALGWYPFYDQQVCGLRDGPPPVTLEDIAGLKIRHGGPPQNKFIEEAGATPVQMSMTDAYLAAQQGAVDGIMTALAGYNTCKGWEVTPHVTWMKGAVASQDDFTLCNLELWNSFPQDIKDKIHLGEQAYYHWLEYEFNPTFAEPTLQSWRDKGSTTYTMTPAEAKVWEELWTDACLSYFLDNAGPKGPEIIKIAEAVRGVKILP